MAMAAAPQLLSLLLPVLLSGYSAEGKTTAAGAYVRPGYKVWARFQMNAHYSAPIHLWQIEIDARFHLRFISSFSTSIST